MTQELKVEKNMKIKIEAMRQETRKKFNSISKGEAFWSCIE